MVFSLMDVIVTMFGMANALVEGLARVVLFCVPGKLKRRKGDLTPASLAARLDRILGEPEAADKEETSNIADRRAPDLDLHELLTEPTRVAIEPQRTARLKGALRLVIAALAFWVILFYIVPWCSSSPIENKSPTAGFSVFCNFFFILGFVVVFFVALYEIVAGSSMICSAELAHLLLIERADKAIGHQWAQELLGKLSYGSIREVLPGVVASFRRATKSSSQSSQSQSTPGTSLMAPPKSVDDQVRAATDTIERSPAGSLKNPDALRHRLGSSSRDWWSRSSPPYRCANRCNADGCPLWPPRRVKRLKTTFAMIYMAILAVAVGGLVLWRRLC